MAELSEVCSRGKGCGGCRRLDEPGGKDYLDPERHTTTREKCGKDDYPNFLPARLIDALEGNNDVKTRRALTLVYWKHLIECPQCLSLIHISEPTRPY